MIIIAIIITSINTFTNKIKKSKKCSRGGSNSRPSDYETDALPTELLKLFVMRTDLKQIYFIKI